MKKFIVFAGIQLLMGVFVLSGCTNPYYSSRKLVYTDHFIIQLRDEAFSESGEKGYAAMVDLTELGKEQEILVLPPYVEGYPVKQFGTQIGIRYTYLNSQNLRKIYLPYTLKAITDKPFRATPNLEQIVFLSINKVKNSGSDFGVANSVVMLKEHIMERGFTQESFEEYVIGKLGRYRLPNIFFYYNHEESPNSGYYWFDYIIDDNIYIIPEDPQREGYTFEGWHIDPECENEWDGAMPQKDAEVKLYAKWEES